MKALQLGAIQQQPQPDSYRGLIDSGISFFQPDNGQLSDENKKIVISYEKLNKWSEIHTKKYLTVALSYLSFKSFDNPQP